MSLEHLTPNIVSTHHAIVIPTFTISNKRGGKMWVNPINSSFPWTSKWSLYGKMIQLQKLNIHKLSKATDYNNAYMPSCEHNWNRALQTHIDWKRIWSIKMSLCTPKDEITWLKLKHRNLKVAKTDIENNRCLMCPNVESMLHLVECERVKRFRWAFGKSGNISARTYRYP